MKCENALALKILFVVSTYICQLGHKQQDFLHLNLF